MTRFLVIGGSGQLGQCFQTIADEFPYYDLFFPTKNVVDLTRPKTLQTFYESKPFDGIINCAAYTAVDHAEEKRDWADAINSHSIQNLVEFIELKKLFLIHFSTDYVFDGEINSSYKEEDLTNPINTYGHSKREGELVLSSCKGTHTIFRTSWLFSPFGKNFVKTISKLSREKKEIQVVNDQRGKPTYGIDLARMLLNNMNHPHFFDHKCYHYAQGSATNRYDFAQKIFAIIGASTQLKAVTSDQFPTVALRPKNSILNTERIEETLSLKIPSWENALKRCLKRIQSNETI